MKIVTNSIKWYKTKFSKDEVKSFANQYWHYGKLEMQTSNNNNSESRRKLIFESEILFIKQNTLIANTVFCLVKTHHHKKVQNVLILQLHHFRYQI